MGRSIVIHGEAMLYVKGPAGSAIASLSELGLAESESRITITPLNKDVIINAWGEAPADVQRKMAYVTCTATLIQYDPAVLQECIRLAMGGAAFGRTGRAGSLIGNGLPRFAAGNNYVGFNLTSPQSGLPWRFYSAYLQSPIGDFMHGTNCGTTTITFRGVPYTTDPWQGGSGASDWIIFDRTLDT